MPTNFTNRTPVTTTIANRTPVTTTWDQRADFLLQESAFYLLLEDGFRIVLSGVTSKTTDWTNRVAI